MMSHHATINLLTNLIHFFLLKVIAHCKEARVVSADLPFANEQYESTKELMSNRVIETAQRDIGFPFRSDKLDMVFATSWPRPSNDIMVNSVENLNPMEELPFDQSLCAGIRSDLPDGRKRVCLSYGIAGLFASSFLMHVAVKNEIMKIAPLIIDMIPLINRKIGSTEEDFDAENGNVDISPGMPVIMKRISFVLRNFTKVFSEGAEVWNAIIACIREEGHIVKVLNDDDMTILDPQFNNLRRKTISTTKLIAILVEHCETGKTIALYNCMQISSAIGGVSTHTCN